KPILGEDTRRWRPRGWPGDGYAKAEGRDDVWFVNVGGCRSAGAEVIIDRAVAALQEIAAAEVTPSRNRGRTQPHETEPTLGDPAGSGRASILAGAGEKTSQRAMMRLPRGARTASASSSTGSPRPDPGRPAPGPRRAATSAPPPGRSPDPETPQRIR